MNHVPVTGAPPHRSATRPALALAALLLLSPAVARAAHWSAPDWRLGIQGTRTSHMFPGYVNDAPDAGAEARAEITTSRRLSAKTKWNLGVRGGAEAWKRFDEANGGWLGLESSVRRGGSQLSAGLEWTPRRVKFPAEPEDAAYRRLEASAGLRQVLRAGLRVQALGRVRTDEFRTAFDARDAVGREGALRLDWSASSALVLRATIEAGHVETAGPKHRHDDRVAGAGLTWRGRRGQLDAKLDSGVARYRDAGPSDSNWRRRDQWLELALGLRRPLGSGLDLVGGGTWLDRQSSRLDRTYTSTSFRLGCEWAVAAP